MDQQSRPRHEKKVKKHCSSAFCCSCFCQAARVKINVLAQKKNLLQCISLVCFIYTCAKKFGTSAKFSARQQQVQNFPQLVIKFILKNIRTVEIPLLQVRISAGRALKERQCTLKGQAWYVNVRGSVHWKGV